MKLRTPLLLLPLMITAACGQEHPLRLGIVAGGNVFDAADLAVREVNATGRVNGKAFRMVRDTSGRPAAEVARDFAADTSLRAVLLDPGVQGARDMAHMLDSLGVPAILLGPPVATPGRWTFTLLPRLEREASLMTGEAEALWKPKRVALVRSPDAYGDSMGAAVRAGLPAGVRVVYDSAYPTATDSVTLDGLAKRLIDANPNLIYWLGGSRELGGVIGPVRAAVLDLRLLGSNAVEAARVYQNKGGNFDGLLFVQAADPTADSARYANFQYRFTVWMGRPTTSAAVLAYDAGAMLAAALRAGASTRPALRDYLASLGGSRPAYAGVGGPIAFDSSGVAKRKLGLAEVTNQGIRRVE